MTLARASFVLLLLAGCPRSEPPPQQQITTTTDPTSASQAVKERLKPGSGLPTDPAVKAIQQGLQQAERQQQRAMDRADRAGAPE